MNLQQPSTFRPFMRELVLFSSIAGRASQYNKVYTITPHVKQIQEVIS